MCNPQPCILLAVSYFTPHPLAFKRRFDLREFPNGDFANKWLLQECSYCKPHGANGPLIGTLVAYGD